jgi:hypothetical protein
LHLYNEFTDSDKGYWKDKKDTGKWYEYQGYKFKLNEDLKERWLNNKFNSRFKNKKKQKISYFSDAAIVLNVDRWVLEENKIIILRRLKRTTLNYWLFPFISKFSIKDGFRWYHSHFFYKEDNKFRSHFNWKYRNKKTPLSTLNYYNNWFFFLLKSKFKSNIKYKTNKRKRAIERYEF